VNYIYIWEQIKGTNKPKISISEKSEDEEDNFKRIEEIYSLLIKNYLAQGDKVSADEVKYELAWQKDILIDSFWQWIYGISLGYGYEPLRYLIFPILLTIIFFCFVWYKMYYNIIAYILNNELDTDLELAPHYSINFQVKKHLGFELINHKNISPKINFITKVWHVLHFSTSVLLGLRFKKEWIRFANKHKTGLNSFLWIVTFEYFLGKIYILLLLIFIKIQPLENWKSFIGL